MVPTYLLKVAPVLLIIILVFSPRPHGFREAAETKVGPMNNRRGVDL